MEILFLICLALSLFIYGYYLGVESSIKSEITSILLESELNKGHKNCIENKDLECIEKIQNMMFMVKKSRIEYILKNDLSIGFGQDIKGYNEWLGVQVASKNKTYNKANSHGQI